ncbi:MAG: hypothetical protein VYC83_01205, partial [Chloroflexota bacterium]|nr:hypothetical protein [Chloroflexota bacterium]
MGREYLDFMSASAKFSCQLGHVGCHPAGPSEVVRRNHADLHCITRVPSSAKESFSIRDLVLWNFLGDESIDQISGLIVGVLN